MPDPQELATLEKQLSKQLGQAVTIDLSVRLVYGGFLVHGE
jgi:hypothetical protein